LRYVGVVRRGLDADNSAELRKRLQALTTPQPVVPGASEKAIWVKPMIVCEVRQSGLSESGRFLTPVFKKVVDWGPAPSPETGAR
jgi:ATP-dependent DNA ligase